MKKNNNRGFAILECVIAMVIIVIITAATITILDSNNANNEKFSNYSDARISADNLLEAFKYADTAKEAMDVLFGLKGNPSRFVHYGTSVEGTYEYIGSDDNEYHSNAWSLLNLKLRDNLGEGKIAGTKEYQFKDGSKLIVTTYPKAKTPYVTLDIEYVYNTCTLNVSMKYYDMIDVEEPEYALTHIDDILNQDYSMISRVEQVRYSKLVGEVDAVDVYADDIAYKYVLNKSKKPVKDPVSGEITNYNMDDATYSIRFKKGVKVYSLFGQKLSSIKPKEDGSWDITISVKTESEYEQENYTFNIKYDETDNRYDISGNFGIMKFNTETGAKNLLPIEMADTYDDSNPATVYYLEASENYVEKSELCEIESVTNTDKDDSSIGFEIETVTEPEQEPESGVSTLKYVKVYKNSVTMSQTAYRFHVSEGAKIELSGVFVSGGEGCEIENPDVSIDGKTTEYTFSQFVEDPEDPSRQLLLRTFVYKTTELESGVFDIEGTFAIEGDNAALVIKPEDLSLKITVVAADSVSKEPSERAHEADYYFSASKKYSDANVYGLAGAKSYYFESELKTQEESTEGEEEPTEEGNEDIGTGNPEEEPENPEEDGEKETDIIHVSIGKDQSIGKHTLEFNIGKFAELRYGESIYVAGPDGKVTIVNGNWEKLPSYVASCNDNGIRIDNSAAFKYDGTFVFHRFSQTIEEQDYYSDWYLNLTEDELNYSWKYAPEGSYFVKNISPEVTPNENLEMEQISTEEEAAISKKKVDSTETHGEINITEYGIVIDQNIEIMKFTVVNTLTGYQNQEIRVISDDGTKENVYLVAVTNENKSNLSSKVNDVTDKKDENSFLTDETKVYDTSTKVFKYEVLDENETVRTVTITTTEIYLNKLAAGMKDATYRIILEKGEQIYSIEEIGGKQVTDLPQDRVMFNAAVGTTKEYHSSDGKTYTLKLEKADRDERFIYSLTGDFDANGIITMYVNDNGESKDNIFKLIFNGSYGTAFVIDKFNRPEFSAICTRNDNPNVTLFEIKKYVKGTKSLN